jgi:hypothetical protein
MKFAAHSARNQGRTCAPTSARPEAAFLNGHVLPSLAAAIRREPSCSRDAAANRALLDEYHPGMKEISSHSPARSANRFLIESSSRGNILPTTVANTHGANSSRIIIKHSFIEGCLSHPRLNHG